MHLEMETLYVACFLIANLMYRIINNDCAIMAAKKSNESSNILKITRTYVKFSLIKAVVESHVKIEIVAR